MSETKIGEITHYFADISVAVLKLSHPLRVEDTIKIAGETTDFQQTVESMQVEHEDVEEVQPGQDVAIKVEDRVREGDDVYLLAE